MTLDVDCPHCGLKLPPISLGVTVTLEDDGSVCSEVQPDLNGFFWGSLRMAHPWCFGGKEDLPSEAAA